MPAPISVIIPTLNAAEDLPGCFACLVPILDAGLLAEVIIVDGGSTDRTLDLAAEWGAVVLTVSPSRGGQLRAGAARAKADNLLFLHADTHLKEGCLAAISAQIGQGPAAFRLGFRSSHPMAKITAGWANLRSRMFGLPYGDQGLLIAKSDYKAAGGYPDIPLMEDVALARKLAKITILPATAWTGADKYDRQGWVRRGWANLRLLTRYLLGANPDDLAKRY